MKKFAFSSSDTDLIASITMALRSLHPGLVCWIGFSCGFPVSSYSKNIAVHRATMSLKYFSCALRLYSLVSVIVLVMKFIVDTLLEATGLNGSDIPCLGKCIDISPSGKRRRVRRMWWSGFLIPAK